MITRMIAPALSLLALAAPQAPAQESADLTRYFGFDEMEIMVIADGFGPVIVGDLDGDGRNDLVAANNYKSRIELLYQRSAPADEEADVLKVNEHEELWRFRREELPVSHRVLAIALHDVNGDGLPDLLYAGQPDEIVIMTQTSPGVFDVSGRRRVPGLRANRDGFFLADVLDDDAPELITLVRNTVAIFPLDGSQLGTPRTLNVGSGLLACFGGDFNGDGLTDLAAVNPEDSSPVRLWFQSMRNGSSELGPQYQFEMPAIREFQPFSYGDRTHAAVIERNSRRVVVYAIEAGNRTLESGDRTTLAVYALPEGSSGAGRVRVVDIDGDGLQDVVAADSSGARLAVFRQERNRGLIDPVYFPTLAKPASIAAGSVDDDPEAEIFVLSQDEKVAGRSDYEDGDLSFPVPLPTQHDLMMIELIDLEVPTAAILSRDRRSHSLRLVPTDGGQPQDIDLESITRTPETIIACDADQDGSPDILLLAPGAPMVMLKGSSSGAFTLHEEAQMGQFGLVRAASGANTASFDVDGDNIEELLVADGAYLRALRYSENPDGGASPGWQVVEQYNMEDPDSRLNAIAVMDDKVAVVDAAGRRVVLLERRDGAWAEAKAVYYEGMDIRMLYAGSFSGSGEPDLLCVGDEGFAVLRFTGDAIKLAQVGVYRNDNDDRLEHEITAGDVNADGFTDLVVLDAGEQMCEILTLSASGRLLHALEFEVFQSKLFSGGEDREFEPRHALIADLTGDSRDDLLLLVHDRLLLYPQSAPR